MIMGMLDRFRPPVVERWNPPTFGACNCADHVDTLLDERIPLADGSGEVTVAELVTAGALSVVPTPNHLYVEAPTTQERRGPFHWRVMHKDALEGLWLEDAPIGLDDLLFLQPGIESVLWLENRTVLAIDGPRLCIRGVQGAVARALMNPRLRAAG